MSLWGISSSDERPAAMNVLEYFSHPHWPNLSLIGHQSLVIQIHLFTALAAFVIATVQMFGPKGTGLHRILGWSWVILMFTVAGSSLLIHIINPKGPGGFSAIHILSLVTLIALPIMVYAARTHNVNLHRRIARNLYFGALVIAGLFTFFPGRLLWHVFFG